MSRSDADHRSGPLRGSRIVELAGVGPGPFCAMMLADLGADVVRLDRASFAAGGADPAGVPQGVLGRGRRSVGVDLKRLDGAELALRLVERADGLVEPYRPGVAERLGIGPDTCLARNPRLVYARVTGYGQHGPLAADAGHDLNYLGLSGMLARLGPAGGPPTAPLPLLGDFASGGLLTAFGLVCGLWEASRSGRGQVIDSAMVDGVALLGTVYHGLRAAGLWSDERGTNFSDGAAPFYQVYQCAGGGHLTVGAYEAPFYAELLRLTDLTDDPDFAAQHDRGRWPTMTRKLAAVFRERTRDAWCAAATSHDACVTPVLTPAEAPAHPHNVARSTFIECAGITQPAPAPRFSRTPGAVPGPPPDPGGHTDEVLREWLDLTDSQIDSLRETGAVA
ncbi:MAG TPA: CaiB/BaiF CoA-transferase family protein [Pseudonocardia sp.]|jgi:alpha-methylacyl-CoA racemase